MAKKLLHCEKCGRLFCPDKFNKHSQKYCTNPECVLERKRERQRNSYREEYHSNQNFQQSERQRCAEGIRRRRAAAKASAALPNDDSRDVTSSLVDVVTGLIAHLTDNNDLDGVSRSFSEFADRGRRLTPFNTS